MGARDRLGRPLRGEAISEHSFPQVPERTFLSGEQAWKEITDYLAQGLPFHAHEVAEQRWRCAPPNERDFWRACAQMGAAHTHDARGNRSRRPTPVLTGAGNFGCSTFTGCHSIDPVALKTFFSAIIEDVSSPDIPERIILVTFDQLSRSHGALATAVPGQDQIVFIESHDMLTARTWHAQRLFFLLSCCEHLKSELDAGGFQVTTIHASSMRAGLEGTTR